VSQPRTFRRFTSCAVIMALVAVTVLMTCGAAFGAPVGGTSTPDSDSCGLDSHSSMAVAGVTAESPKITVVLSAVLPVDDLVGISQGVFNGSAIISTELPLPSDPLHGQLRV
jgi:hypothetical protein